MPPVALAAVTVAVAAAAEAGLAATVARAAAQIAPVLPQGPLALAKQVINNRDRSAVPAPESLHPALWLGHQLGRQVDHAVSSGFPGLDDQLPGGGWPRRVLTELLLQHPGVGEIRLLAHTLAAAQKQGRLVMLFDPPAQLSAPALAGLGIAVAQLLVVNTRTKVIPGADSLWALEQALKSGHVGAVVAWLPPRLRVERLRRLQLAAQAHDGPAFVMREMEARQRPTAAPLRLALRPGGGDGLVVRVLKRRGPPLESALLLDLPPVLSGIAARRARNIAPKRGPTDSAADTRAMPHAAMALALCADDAEDLGHHSDSLRAATFVNLEPPRS